MLQGYLTARDESDGKGTTRTTKGKGLGKYDGTCIVGGTLVLIQELLYLGGKGEQLYSMFPMLISYIVMTKKQYDILYMVVMFAKKFGILSTLVV